MASCYNLFLFSSLCFLSMAAFSESAYQFRVGGPRGWIEPTGNETETYNEWAARNRFRVGDSLYFKYKNDSVMVVEEDDYKSCNTSNPISEFNDGNTLYKFDRYGEFYFISGVPRHCQSGQKVVVWVMGQSVAERPESAAAAAAPPPSAGGGGQGGQGGGQSGQGGGSSSTPSKRPPHAPDSSAKITVHSVAAALGGIMVISLFA